MVAAGLAARAARCRSPTPSASRARCRSWSRRSAPSGRPRDDHRDGHRVESSTCARPRSSASSTCCRPIYRATAAYGHFGRDRRGLPLGAHRSRRGAARGAAGLARARPGLTPLTGAVRRPARDGARPVDRARSTTRCLRSSTAPCSRALGRRGRAREPALVRGVVDGAPGAPSGAVAAAEARCVERLAGEVAASPLLDLAELDRRLLRVDACPGAGAGAPAATSRPAARAVGARPDRRAGRPPASAEIAGSTPLAAARCRSPSWSRAPGRRAATVRRLHERGLVGARGAAARRHRGAHVAASS